MPLRAGLLTAVLDGVDLRYVKLGEVELVRRIYAAVRDQNWNTIPGVAVNSELDVREDSFDVRFEVRHANDELDFSWRGTITGTAEGRMSFSLDGAAGRDFPYNRIGFCVLHPWREAAGARYRGETPDGPVEGRFPLSVGPQAFVDGLYVSLFPAVEPPGARRGRRHDGRVRARGRSVRDARTSATGPTRRSRRTARPWPSACRTRRRRVSASLRR